MTQNRDRKQAIRARMAATGEPYTEAARNLDTPACGDADGDPGETVGLVDQILGGYREHAAEEAGPVAVAVPGRVTGNDIESQADALEDAAVQLAEMLTAFGREPRRSLDAIAVFRALSRASESLAAAAAEMRRQEWFDLDDAEEPDEAAAWTGALKGLRSASSTFGWVADGWI
jgi:hypothetical protein